MDKSTILAHGPANLTPLEELPRPLVKLEAFINQRIPPPSLNPKATSFFLPPFELAKNFYYYGQWFKGQRNGIGRLYFPDKCAYYG